MKELKISLVGWGKEQIMLHLFHNTAGVTVWRKGRVVSFGLTPWLREHIAVVRPSTAYQHGVASEDTRELVMHLRQDAVLQGVVAIRDRDIYTLSEAVISSYMAQQCMGGEPLENRGELAKRYAGSLAIYLFPSAELASSNCQLETSLAWK